MFATLKFRAYSPDEFEIFFKKLLIITNKYGIIITERKKRGKQNGKHKHHSSQRRN